MSNSVAATCGIAMPAVLLEKVERASTSEMTLSNGLAVADAGLIRSVRLTTKGNVYIEVVAAGLMDGRISVDSYKALLSDALTYITSNRVKHKQKIQQLITRAELSESDEHATGLPATKIDDTEVVRLWYGQQDKNAGLTIVQRFELAITTELIASPNVFIDKVGYYFDKGIMTKYIKFDIPKVIRSKKNEQIVTKEFKGAPAALIEASKRYVVIIKQKERTFIDTLTGLFYAPDKLLLVLESRYDQMFSRIVHTNDGDTRTVLAPQWLRDFYIEYLVAKCEKVSEVHYRRGKESEDIITIKNRVMTIMVAPLEPREPVLARLANHQQLLPLIDRQYPELAKMLALMILNNRSDYDGVFRKTVLNKIIAESNAGKTYLFNDILGKGLQIFGTEELRSLIEFTGQGSKISGITDPSVLIRPMGLCIDEAGAKDFTSKENQATANMYKGMGSGLTGRGLNTDNVTIHLNHVVSLSRVQQLDSTDELLNRDLELDWGSSRALIDGARNWLPTEITQREFKTVSLWYAYDILVSYMNKSDDELEEIVKTFKSLQKNAKLLHQHKTRHVESLFTVMASALEQIDDGEIEKELVVALRNNSHSKTAYLKEAFVFQRKTIGNELQDLRGNTLDDAKVFLERFVISLPRTTTKSGHCIVNIYYALPVWFGIIERECGFNLTSSEDNLLEVSHSPYWDKLMEISLEDLIGKLKAIFIAPPLEVLTLNELRDIYTAIFIKCYNSPYKRIAEAKKIDLGGIL